MSLYVEGDVPYVANGNCNNGGMGFGGNGWGDLAALIVVAGLFGWGNGGFGGFGGGNRGGACATQADLAAGFANSEIMSDLNSIINTLTQGFAGINTAVANATSTLGFNMAQGFHGVDNAVCTLGYNMQSGFNALGHQISDCCCTQSRNIDSLRYDMAKGFCDIARAGQDNTRAILDYLSGEKIASLQAENAGLKAQISNDKQSAYLISQLREPCPIPAYITPNPNCCYNYGVYPVNNGFCGASVQ
jgi:hypothetical protein